MTPTKLITCYHQTALRTCINLLPKFTSQEHTVQHNIATNYADTLHTQPDKWYNGSLVMSHNMSWNVEDMAVAYLMLGCLTPDCLLVWCIHHVTAHPVPPCLVGMEVTNQWVGCWRMHCKVSWPTVRYNCLGTNAHNTYPLEARERL